MRQAPPGCREGPVYLSGGRRAESRRHQFAIYKVCMKEVSLYGCQCRVRCCCLRREAPMCSNHGIDNCPTVNATPSGILMVTRPESSKIFKLITQNQSITAWAPHRMPPSLTGS